MPIACSASASCSRAPPSGRITVAFVDQRIFGSLAIDPLVPTGDGAPGGLGDDEAVLPSQVAHIARDPLDPAFDDAGFLRRAPSASAPASSGRCSTRRSSPASATSTPTRRSGPRGCTTRRRPTGSRGPRAMRLLAELRLVLERALADGGTSFDAQYVNVNGASGYFSQRLNAYGQQGKPCPRCGTPIVREPFMNRSSHLCPVCQRRPRHRATPVRA